MISVQFLSGSSVTFWPPDDHSEILLLNKILNLQALVATDIDIKSDYDAKYGAPTSACPKVFFRYFYVNTTTGEKSGEMLVEGRLSAE